MDAIKKAIGTYRYGLWVNAGSPRARKDILAVKGLGLKSADRIVALLETMSAGASPQCPPKCTAYVKARLSGTPTVSNIYRILSDGNLYPKNQLWGQADRIHEFLTQPKPSLEGLELDFGINGWLQIDGKNVKCEYVWHNGHGLIVEAHTGDLVTSFTVPGREIFSSHDLGTDLRHHGGVTLSLGTCRELGLTEATWSYI